MNGEFISIETAEKIAKLEKENKRLRKGLKKAINKICEQDVSIAKALEYIQSNDFIYDLQYVKEEKLCNMLKGERNEIR